MEKCVLGGRGIYEKKSLYVEKHKCLLYTERRKKLLCMKKNNNLSILCSNLEHMPGEGGS